MVAKRKRKKIKEVSVKIQEEKIWTLQLAIICGFVLCLFGIAAILIYKASSGWVWFLLAAMAVMSGIEFKESNFDETSNNSDINIHHHDGVPDSGANIPKVQDNNDLRN